MKPGPYLLRSFFLLSVLIIIGNRSLLTAQNATGSLHGQVKDPSGAIVSGATIKLTGPGGQIAPVKTGADGAYEVKGLAPGAYTVQVDSAGFATYKKEAVQIAAGAAQSLDISLTLPTEQEQVTVSADTMAVDINPANNTNSVVLTEKELAALPDDPDELQSDLEALAGPSVGPNGGQMYIDGFTAGQLPPKSAIREIRINQNPFSAEYDKAGYGRIEIFTKPGTDQWHGQVFVNGNASAFNTKSPFATDEAAGYNSVQASGNIGGPLSKKASFFLNVDTRDIMDTSIVSAYPLNPADTGVIPFSDSISNPRTRLNISPRIDYQLSKTNTLSVRYQFYRDNQTNDGVGGLSFASQSYNVLTTEQTVQVSDTQTIGSKMINETRFQFLRDDSTQAAQSALPTLTVPGAFSDGGQSTGNTTDRTNHYEIQNYSSVALSKHFIIFGTRIRNVTDSNYSTSGMNGSFIFPSLTAYENYQADLNGCQAAGTCLPNLFTVTTGSPHANISTTDAAFYVEDTWTARKNVTVSYGIRFETQNDIRDHNDWAPRVGIAWGIGGSSGKSAPKTVLRAGFGMFYDRFTSNLILLADRLNGITQEQFVVPNPTFYPNVPPAGSLTFPTIYQISPTLHAPYTVQSGASIERQLTKIVNVTVSYLNSRGFDQLLTNNINAPLPGTYIPGDLMSGTRPNGTLENIYQFQSDANFVQNQLIVNTSVRAGARLTLNGYYTLNYANSDTSGPYSFPSNPYDISDDYGRASFDIRHRVFLGGTMSLPHAITVSPFVLVSSGTPYNIALNQDLIGSSILNQRPAFCTHPNATSNCIQTAYGDFDANPAPGEQIVPINYLTGPVHFTMNLRLTKTVGFGKPVEGRNGATPGQGGGPGGGGRGGGGGGGGARGGAGNPFGRAGGGGGLSTVTHRYNLTFSVNARNIFNYVNLATPIGNLNSPLFGRSDALAGGAYSTQSADRQIFLQTTFSF